MLIRGRSLPEGALLSEGFDDAGLGDQVGQALRQQLRDISTQWCPEKQRSEPGERAEHGVGGHEAIAHDVAPFAGRTNALDRARAAEAIERSVDTLRLTRGEADIALRLVRVKEAALRVRCVARLGFGLFAAPHYLHARGVPRTPAALSGHDVLLPGGELAATPEGKWLEARAGVRVVFRSNSFPTLVEAAAAGLGIVPLALVWGDRDRRLERLMPIESVAKRGVWLVTKPEGALRTEVRVVGDRIAAILAASVRA